MGIGMGIGIAVILVADTKNHSLKLEKVSIGAKSVDLHSLLSIGNDNALTRHRQPHLVQHHRIE
jgi:hypothetical protein